ncbi:trans-sulfuration enzyme family protein [Gracilimonas mengyeensis]|uniref:Cystathionine gamma-synthase n=1 Tax=Gracilimonas mengyeensis TaxID=1302730 RepID=A0A521BLH9_9BACT|nr:aminotransferase class I/II-fold pyridoxal phosphate-dependent enzyme [Gracilimonas mengyeensis]SMO47651.1 cystathionine gamma-synthase [Gracilimonas mengyeensis]
MSSLPTKNIETIAIHGSMKQEPGENEPLVPGIELSTIYEHRKEGQQDGDWKYTRISNPNRVQLENVLKDLEGGDACAAFSSGIAAISSVFQTLEAGSHLLLPEDVYFGTRKLVWEFAERWNLEADFIDMTDLEVIKSSIKENTKMLWLETPSNPRLLITDVVEVSKLAHKNGAIAAVDSTWPTPYNMRPLELGADIVVHSTTKYLGGHSDILGGAVITKENNELFEKIRTIQVIQGAAPSPQDCWLLSRSIRSFPYRMRAHNENARKVADFLVNHPKIMKVYYPGLESHPGHEIAKEQMKDFGGMISFLIDGTKEDAIAVASSSKVITAATSLGGIESIWEHRKSSEGEESKTPDNLIRLSVGLEHPDDLIADIEQALG